MLRLSNHAEEYCPASDIHSHCYHSRENMPRVRRCCKCGEWLIPAALAAFIFDPIPFSGKKRSLHGKCAVIPFRQRNNGGA